MATGYGPAPTLHVFVQQDLCTCSTFVSFPMLTAHGTACFTLVWSHVTPNLSKDLISMRTVKAGLRHLTYRHRNFVCVLCRPSEMHSQVEDEM